MTEFWLFIIVLLAMALAIVLLPLMFWRPAPLQLDERLRLNVDVYHQRLSELESDHQKTLIDDRQLAQLRTELQRSLLVDTDRRQYHAEKIAEGKAGKTLIVILLLVIPLTSWIFYSRLGSIEDWTISQLMRDRMVAVQHGGDDSAVQKRLLVALEKRLKTRPDNIEYHVMLARSYMAEDQFDQAAVVYAKLIELLPKDPDARAYYAQALYLARGRKIDSSVQQAIDATLALNPNNTLVLGMMGMSAFQRGDYRGAIEAWQKLISLLPPSAPDVAMLKQGVAHARKSLAEQGEEPPAQISAPEVESGVSLSVSISLKEGLGAKPEQTVFVFAKAAQGPPMPLAVVRLQVKDLPKQVTLDDSMAMTPAMKLSSFSEIVLVARVSASGGATKQSGDLQGSSGVVNTADIQSVELIIDQRVP